MDVSMKLKKNKTVSVILASLLATIFSTSPSALAEEILQEALVAPEQVRGEILDIQPVEFDGLNDVDRKLVKEVFALISEETKQKLKELVAQWASQGLLADINEQLGIVSEDGKLVVKDMAEKDLSGVENDILNLLTTLHIESKLVPFISSLIEILKKDPKHSAMVSALTLDQKVLLLSMLDQTISSTGALREFSPETWTELSDKISKKLNRFETDKKSQTRLSDPAFMSELVDAANASFVSTQKTQILIDGPASFSLRDAQMKAAKESINMLTWAVIDDKTGTELADLLIEKAKTIKVRLIVDGQVSQRIGYKEQVKRMEENGVSVIRWYNPNATFMGQHRKILVIDEALVISGGMNPGDTYSHKAGEGKHLWRDTDVAFQGEAVEEAQRLFTAIWNKQIVDQKLKQTKIVKVKKAIAKKGDGKVMVIDHQPKASGDQHEILMATMKAIRGAEKTVDIENAYVIVFPSLLNEIKAAIGRGVKVRVLTNSNQSVDEPIVALPIMRSAKKLSDIGAEVYLKQGSTLHSKFMIVDNRLFLIGSYNLHPRSERMEGETVMIFDNKRLADSATKAFEKDISSTEATKMEKSTELVLPINGTTLLPLRMFYDQL
jgi:cardiolipin synthase A/B